MSGQKSPRVIFHIDMNSFYASVELAHHPEWRGKPLAIAGKQEERHGIVVTSSYEARKMGVRTTMTVNEARQKCPQLIVKHPDFFLYRQTSEQLFQMLKNYTTLVEKASIDEGYMDVSSLLNKWHPLKLAQELQQRILKQLYLPCSIGIAPNKFLAKMASNMKKPLGLTVLRKRELGTMLWPLPIGQMHGIGPKTEEKLKKTGIMTIGALAHSDLLEISSRYGQMGRKMWEHANGIDSRVVDPEAWDRYKSIGHSSTLPHDTTSSEEIGKLLADLSAKLAGKIKREHVVSYELMITLRYADWKTTTKHLSVSQPLYTEEEILDQALTLFRLIWTGASIRLLGVTLTDFHPYASSTKQLDLFSYTHDLKDESLQQLIEQVNEQFGSGAIRPAAALVNYQKKRDSQSRD
ncbi:MAG: DNA polymerase IV [Sporolactobacillus sp.]